jgi:hypothetical protein
MKMTYFSPMVGLFAVLTAPLHADLYVTNFTSQVSPSGASGVWKNQTTSTDLSIPISISQEGGMAIADGSGSTSSKVDDSFPWQALPLFAGGANAFSPNFDGDYINIETQQGDTTTVTLDFGATVTDPVISFTDVEDRTTITFTDTFSIPVEAGTSNLVATGTTISSTGLEAAMDSFGLFDTEAAGSIKFPGTFTKIVFTVSVGPPTAVDPGVGTNDRTGYVVSTMTEPVPLVATECVELQIDETDGKVTLTWPLGGFTEILISDPGVISGFTPIEGLDPGSVSTWSETTAVLGEGRFFRGVCSP